MKKTELFILLLTPFVFISLFAQRGKNGALVVAAANTIVNEYTTLSASVGAGTTTIPVTASSLNANSRFPATLAPGDLIMIYEAQGVFINGFASGTIGLPNDTSWGRPVDLYNCGRYEFAEVRSVPNATSIELDCGLRYSYDVNGFNQKAIVIRVPRYTSLTVNSGGVLTCDDWNGTIGGMLAVEVQNNTVVNAGGLIDATGKGFRGGSLTGDNGSSFGVNNVASTDLNYGAERGEGVAGYQGIYDVWGGRYGRGAAANAGGGACAHNGGGGGGANAASNIYNWKGWGLPDLSGVNYNLAWNQDNVAIAGLTNANSAGGGRGGYSFSANNQNAVTTGPSVGTWGGDSRNRDAAGWGGRALDYSTGRIYYGGGGGSGDQNNNAGGPGGDGGGIVYLMCYGTISGAGTISSNGNNGVTATGPAPFSSWGGNDAGGGAGAGGVVILNSAGALSGLTVNVNGGTGGNQALTRGGGYFGAINEAEGPGGGGGGGYIAYATGAPATQTAAGGNNGTTNSDALTEFLPNGALRGCNGLTGQSITNFTINSSNVTICSGSTANLTATLGGTPPGGTTIIWYDALVAGNQLGTGGTYTTPTLTTTTTFYVGTCPGTYRIPVVVTVNPLPTVNITPTTTVCATSPSFNLSGSPAGGTWSGTGITNSTNGTFSPSTAGAGTFTITYSYTDGNGCTNTDTEPVTVNAAPNATINSVSPVCAGSAPFNMTAATGGGTWSGTGITNATNGTFDPSVSGTGTFVVTYSIGGTCPATDQETVTVNAPPNATINAVSAVCTTTAPFNMTAATGGGTWSGTGITNATNGTFDPSVSGTGTFVVTYSIGGTCPASDQETVTVNAPPNATINSVAPVCAGSAPFNMTAATGGGTWSGTGITNATNGTLNPSTAGTFTITYSIGGTCPSSDQETVTVNPQSNASITPAGPVCVSAPAFNLTSAQGGGTWTGTGITNATNGTFDPGVAGTGTFSIVYTIGGSCPDDDTIQLVVNNTLNSTINAVAPVCNNAAPFNLTAASPGGTWSGSGITNATNGTFDPAAAGTGTFTITYTISGSCGSSDTETLTVIAAANASINAVSPVCDNAAAFNLTAAQSGGTWSGTGITNTTNGTFDPSVSGAGTFNVIYTISGSCGDDDTLAVVVNATPDPTISNVSAVCSNSSSFNFSAADPGGTWSGMGITDAANGTFDPLTSGPGTFTITYSIPGSCPASDTAIATVLSNANASISPVSPVCDSSASFNLSSAQGGGIWSGAGITDSLNGTFDPDSSGAGTFSIIYTIAGQCGDDDTASVTVLQTPDPTISAVSSLCSGSSAISLTAASGGGTWSGTGISDSLAGTFDPSVSGAGTFTVSYSLSGTCPSSDTTLVSVIQNADASITSSTAFCANAAPSNLSSVQAGGTWSGTGITDSINGTFDPATSGAGTFIIYYSIGVQCGDLDSVQITVSNSFDATISPAPVFCLNGGSSNLSAADAGGVWSGTGITDSLNGTFDPAISGAGTFTVSYTIVGNCGGTDTAVVTVNTIPDATIAQPGPVCLTGGAITLSAATPGGTWSGTGITNASAGTFDPSVSGAGSFPVIYTLTGSCADDDTISITVTNTISSTINPAGPFCSNDTVVTLSAANGGGTWSGNGITNAAAGTFDPSVAGPGTSSITYNIPGSCGSTSTVSIVVNPYADPTITSASPVFCQGDAAVNFTSAQSGGTWVGTGITNSVSGTFDPSVSGAGNFLITYSFAGPCASSDTLIVTVNAAPVASILNLPITGCSPLCVNFSSTAAPNYSWNFADSSSIDTTQNPVHCFTTPGTYSVELVASAGSCSDTDNVVITVYQSATAGFTVSPGMVLGPGSPFTFNTTATGASGYFWYFNDPASTADTSVAANPSWSYTDTGYYCVMQIAIGQGGCNDTTVECVLVIDDYVVVIPNVFTPNGDGVNDVFMINAAGLKDLKCDIYDRWGLKMGEFTGVSGYWDGTTTSGKKASNGTYYYILRYTDIKFDEFETKGYLQLIGD